MEQKGTKTESEKRDWSSVTRLLPWTLLLPLGILLPSICAGRKELFEAYALRFYPQIKDAISSVTSLIPISLAEVILYALVIGIPLRILTRFVMLLLRKTDPVRFVRMLVRIVIIGGVVWNLFYVTWGFNYFREPLPLARMGADRGLYSENPSMQNALKSWIRKEMSCPSRTTSRSLNTISRWASISGIPIPITIIPQNIRINKIWVKCEGTKC